MTKNKKKAILKLLRNPSFVNEEMYPVNYEKAIKHLKRKGLWNEDNQSQND